MKISSEYIGRILEAQLNRVQQTRLDQPTAPAQKPDQATFSSKAAEIEQALQVVSRQPEVRADKVAELREKIANGTFKVDAELVADKLLAEARMEKLAKGH